MKPPADLVQVGRITGVYGVRGWVRLDSFGGADTVLASIADVWIGKSPALSQFSIAQIKEHSGQLLASLDSVNDRDRAAALKGQEVWVSRTFFPAPDEDEYYWLDLIGCAVENNSGENLGVVVRIEDHGADPVMRIEIAQDGDPKPKPRVRLIPFVHAHVTRVDTEAKRLWVDWDSAWD